MTATSDRRVVIVHDWLTGMRGGEKVLESICRLYPEAELLTLVYKRGSVSSTIERHRIRTSVVQRFPRPFRWYREYLPAFPTVIELFDLDDADLVISTSHCAAKAVVSGGRAVHVCYCHSPMRYAWDQFDQYFGEARVGKTRSRLLRPVLAWLARWDRDTAPRVHRFIANSSHVAGRIGRYYNRRASVLHPPVDTRFFTPGDADATGRYFLVVSALVPYKRIDVAIQAAALANVPLRIVGSGPDEARLRAMAGPTVEFLGSISDDALRTTYQGATALVLPAEEDFGIAIVESLACGRPVVALGRGGARESIVDGRHGVLVNEATADAFAAAFDRVRRTTFDPATLRAAAESFGVDRFESQFQTMVTETMAQPAAW